MEEEARKTIESSRAIKASPAQLKVTGMGLLISSGLAAAGLLVPAYIYQLGVLRPAGLYFMILTGLALIVRQMLELRAGLWERLREDKPEDISEQEHNAKIEAAAADIERFGAGFRNYMMLVLGAATAGLSVYFFLLVSRVLATETVATACGALCMLMAFGCVVGSRYYSTLGEDILPESRGISYWLKLGTFIMLVTAVSLFLRGLKFPLWEATTAQVLNAGILVLAIELIGRAAGGIFSPRKNYSEILVPLNLLTLRALVSQTNPVSSLFSSIEEYFGINLKSTWALTFFKRSLAPIAALLVIIGWLCSSLVMVDITEQGIHERFGNPLSKEPLQPGLHVIYPWPVDRIVRVPVHRVRVMSIGYEGADPTRSLLWTKPHAETEFSLMLGDGRDLITVNADLAWRINNAYDYIYTCQNPEEALNVIAYRVLLKETVGRSLDDVLSDNVNEISKRIHDNIQKAVERDNLGIEIIDFYLKGLHPPVAIAPDYQSVVSSQVDKKTRIINANAYRMESLPMSEAEAIWTINNSEAQKATRLAEARGEAIQFTTLEKQYSAAPGIYRLRRELEGLETALKMKKIFIVDDRIEGAGGTLWLDFRKNYQSDF